MLLGSSTGALVALSFAARYPERLAGLVLISAVARYVHARSIAEFDRLGGAQAGEVAARYFAEPDEATFAEYLRVCLPLYTRRAARPGRRRAHAHEPRGDDPLGPRRGGKLDLREAVGRIAARCCCSRARTIRRSRSPVPRSWRRRCRRC